MVEREAPLPGLEPAERRHVDAGSFGDLLEGQTLLRPQFLEAPANPYIDRLVVLVCLHGKPGWHK